MRRGAARARTQRLAAQISLFAAKIAAPQAAAPPPEEPAEPPLPPRLPAEPPPDADAAILEALRTAYAPLRKAELLARTALAETAWKVALDRLKAEARVEQVGERRGTKYRLAGRGEA